MLLALMVLLIAAIGTVVYLTIYQTASDKVLNEERILTIADLDDPDFQPTPNISDTSVENLTKEFKAKIDRQIAAKENPFETVSQLANVLLNTLDEKRQDQTSGFIEDFLASREYALWFNDEHGNTPDQAQVNHWKAKLYALLVRNYQTIMALQLTGPDGKSRNTTQDQLRYINLYLEIAQNPTNWGEPQISYVDGHTWYFYTYEDTDDFVVLGQRLESSRAGSAR